MSQRPWLWLRAKWSGYCSASVITYFAWAKFLIYSKSLFNPKSLIPRLKELWETRRVHLTQAPWLFLPFPRCKQPAKPPDLSFSDLRYLSRIFESKKGPHSIYQFQSFWSEQVWFDPIDPYHLEHGLCSWAKTLTRQNIHLARGKSFDLQPNSNSFINLVNHNPFQITFFQVVLSNFRSICWASMLWQYKCYQQKSPRKPFIAQSPCSRSVDHLIVQELTQ